MSREQMYFPSLFPGSTLLSLNLWVQEANQVEKRIKQLYKHLAKTCAPPRHIPVSAHGKMLAAASGQMLQDLGGLG